jgi:hypothetical protein
MGAIKDANQWIACLPHRIFISITGSEEITDQEGNVINAIAYWNNKKIKIFIPGTLNILSWIPCKA